MAALDDNAAQERLGARPAWRPRHAWFGAAAATGVLLTLGLPGDIPFVNDEPWLLRLAWTANHEGTLAAAGLPGSFGVRYHAAAVWVYQGLLLVTHHLPLLAIIKTALMLATTLAALELVARRTGFTRWPVLLLLLSPYHWHYCRMLWDNVLLIPTAAVLATAPYIWHLARSTRTAERIALYQGANWVDLLDGLLALRWLSFSGFADSLELGLLGPRALLSPLAIRSLTAVTWLGLGFVVLGAGVAGGRLWASWRHRRWPALPEQLAVAALLMAGLHTALLLLLNQRSLPHYHNASWIAQFWLAWYGFEAARAWHPRLAAGALGAAALALAILLVNAAVFIHVNGGNRRLSYGATLRNQLAAAAALARYPSPPATTVINDVSNYLNFPHTLRFLAALAAEEAGPPTGPAGRRLLLTYANPRPDPDDGWLTVTELPTAPAVPTPPAAAPP